MKGRIVVVKEYGKPFEIEEYDVPEPEPGATLLRMTQAGVCGSDLHTWRGDQTQEHMPIPPSGRVMGHERDRRGGSPGRRGSHGHFGRPRLQRETGWSIRPFSPATAATCACGAIPTGAPIEPIPPPEFTPTSPGPTPISFICRPDIPSSGCPDELPDELLGPVNCAMGTVTTGLMRAGAHEGQYVVIQGAGGLGLNAIAMAKDMGADRVIVLDRLENRLELAEEFGADYTINIEEFNTPETPHPPGMGVDQRPGRGCSNGAGRPGRIAGRRHRYAEQRRQLCRDWRHCAGTRGIH